MAELQKKVDQLVLVDQDQRSAEEILESEEEDSQGKSI